MHSQNTHDVGPNYFMWTVAIFSSRESISDLAATIRSISSASDESTVIDVLINGNDDLAREAVELMKAMPAVTDSPAIRVWSIALAGKAHSWNQYVHRIWPGSRLAFFADGYLRVKPDAFRLLGESMARHPAALGGCGIPTTGKSARHYKDNALKHGGLHGALFALKESTMIELKEKGIRLPLGLYGFDSLLGAILAFRLNPSKYHWDVLSNVIMSFDVPFAMSEKRWWHLSDVKTHLNRIRNNALRKLVVQATIEFLKHRKLSPENLPQTVEEFVLGWMDDCPADARQLLWKSPLCRLALRKLREPKDWSAANRLPELVYSSRQTL